MVLSLSCLLMLGSRGSWGASVNSSRAESLTVRNCLERMSPGLNLGNTLEAIPNETAWGNPPPAEAFFKAVHSAGFRSIWIPVAWAQYADRENQIRLPWLVHVKEVVRSATRSGLYVVINIHWDGGWMQPTAAQSSAVNARLSKFWTQIATNFRDFDDHLLFAGTNEVHVEGNYAPPTSENVDVQNSFNQTFVDAVRATGGQNRSRFLVVQSYNADIDNAVKFNAKLPNDRSKGRLMMEVHYYSPYNFTLNEKSDIWQWGAKATDPHAKDPWGDEGYVDAQFQKMKVAFFDRGAPVVLGEYAAGLKPKYPGMKTYRNEWDRYVTQSAYRHGLVPMYWDIGSAEGLFSRIDGAPMDPELIKTITEALK